VHDNDDDGADDDDGVDNEPPGYRIEGIVVKASVEKTQSTDVATDNRR
jgi:hypothetical protein